MNISIEDLGMASSIGGLMVMFGMAMIVMVFIPQKLTRGHIHRSSDSLDRDYRLWRRFKVGIATFGVGLTVAGTLVEMYWI
ncbi:MAG: hypothetical protein AAF563_05200 [Pseudomonadota bacterium]